jgi:hypothetical protein
MNSNRNFRAAIFLLSFLVGSSMLVGSAARAQRMAGGVAARPVMTRRAAVRPVATHAPARPAFSNVFFNPNASASIFQPGLLGFGSGQLLGYNGLGFDPIEGAIDPATQWRIAVAERFLRNTRGFGLGGGYYLLDGGGYYPIPEETSDSAPEQQQPQVIVVQGGPPAAQTAAAPEPAAEQPAPDVGQFTLVLRNGTHIQTVAFTHLNDQIVYITSDGGRHTLAASSLDPDATVQVNEERGTPLQLPL